MKKEDIFNAYVKGSPEQKNDVKLYFARNTKKFEPDWVETIEACILSLDNIVRNPRKFIVIEEDIIDISLAKSITTDSVKHLAQHTNLISSVNKEGMVLPNKILNTSKEESYEVYENRFIYTLLLKLRDFISKRFDLIKKAFAGNGETVQLSYNSSLNTGKTKILYKLDMVCAVPFLSGEKSDSPDMALYERIEKLSRVVSDFLGSAFAKQMVSSAPVRPPIQRTNVILKNNDFKKALTLWQFIETYEKDGFSVESAQRPAEIPESAVMNLKNFRYLNTMLFEAVIPKSSVSNELEMSIVKETRERLFSEGTDKGGEESKEGQHEKQNENLEEKHKTEENAEKEGKENNKDALKDRQKRGEPEEKEQDYDEKYPDAVFDLPEIRNVYEKIEEEEKAKDSQIKRTNLIIDRVLLAKKEIDAKLQKEEVLKLKEKQKKEEEKLKKLVLYEKKEQDRLEALRLRQETAELERQNRLKILLEKQEQKKRLEEIKAAQKAEAEEQKRLTLIRQEQARRLEETNIALFKAEISLKEKLALLKADEDKKAARYRIEKDNAIKILKLQESETIEKIREYSKQYIKNLAEEQNKKLQVYREQDEKDSLMYLYMQTTLLEMKKKSAVLKEMIRSMENKLEDL